MARILRHTSGSKYRLFVTTLFGYLANVPQQLPIRFNLEICSIYFIQTHRLLSGQGSGARAAELCGMFVVLY